MRYLLILIFLVGCTATPSATAPVPTSPPPIATPTPEPTDAPTPESTVEAGLEAACDVLAEMRQLASSVELLTASLDDYAQFTAAATAMLDQLGEADEQMDEIPSTGRFANWKELALRIQLHMTQAILQYDSGVSGQDVAALNAGNSELQDAVDLIADWNAEADTFEGQCE